MSRPVNFTEATYLALHAMALAAASGETPLSIHGMAETLQASEAHLAKVIQRLSRSGLVQTTRGPKGGVVLAKKPDETTYLEIFEAIEGPLKPAGCVFGRDECACEKCIFGDFISKMTEETRAWLKANTLADFANFGE
ncbi:Rrf2 family transcriptional regulator [Synergistaceae bacterium OttesenSCG-928-D05]|nr:Rrf2 family transcriptional regulator [Synergistaceae bacterium OttesenSCG-928-D05]